jgi:penicillin-binding protein 2
MFERRLKIFFGIMVAMVGVLLLRSAHVQIVQAEDWKKQADDSLRQSEMLATVRGKITDRHGKVLACDEPCIDAAVDFRAIDRDEDWMKAQATARLLTNSPEAYRKAKKDERKKMVEGEVARLNADLDEMWLALAREGGKSMDEIEEIRSAVRQRVEMRRRSVWYAKYQRAMSKRPGNGPEPWYKEWMLGGASTPQLDSFGVDVEEQRQAHVILSNVSNEAVIRLKKMSERFPGLVLRPSKHRVYPFGAVACHVIGNLSPVVHEDLAKDPNIGNDLLEYRLNDQIGRNGIEAYCESLLRGSRGKVERMAGREEVISRTEPQVGNDVRLSIDIDLQAELENAFRDVKWYDDNDVLIEHHEMHGAVVVIDVASGDILALVSNPTFDLNTLAEQYSKLVSDPINAPLLNRATQAPHEPGSTVKPMVGMGAITQGSLRVDETIECTGFLKIDGKQQLFGRCWTAQRFWNTQYRALVAHHQLPDKDPHPTGHLVFADAIQRSCNVFFETVGDRLKADGLRYWFSQFGLGQKVGIGIAEFAGRIPGDPKRAETAQRSTSWFSAIGQGEVLATPLQMANVAATIARDGIWVRPHLVSGDSKPPSTQPAAEDRRDLRILPEALAAAKEGMRRVVNTRAGSGWVLRRSGLTVCGKTGTAQASRFTIPLKDAQGKDVLDAEGHRVYQEFPISTLAKPNLTMPWYRGSGLSGKELSHAWFMSFAPMDHPQVAFAVMLEYGGSGGGDAAPVTRAVLDGCIKHGYLRPTDQAPLNLTAQR